MESITITEITPAELQTLVEQSIRKVLAEPKSENAPPESYNLLTITEAAELLKLSVPTIYGYVHRREIPVSKRGKRLYFSKHELVDWVKEGRKKTYAEIEQQANSRLKQNSL